MYHEKLYKLKRIEHLLAWETSNLQLNHVIKSQIFYLRVANFVVFSYDDVFIAYNKVWVVTCHVELKNNLIINI